MRKVDIRRRVALLDHQLKFRHATPASQAPERQQLISECQQAGDHVFNDAIVHAHGIADVCMFCGLRANAAQQRIARALVTG